MAVRRIKQGDTRAYQAVLKTNGEEVDLGSGAQTADVRFSMKPKMAGVGTVIAEAAAFVLQVGSGAGPITDKGKVEYRWAAGQTDVPGIHNVEWEVTFADGTVETFPSGGFDPGDDYEIIHIVTALG